MLRACWLGPAKPRHKVDNGKCREALAIVRSGALSLRAAAKWFKIPYSNLQRRNKEGMSEWEPAGPPPVLSEEEENVIGERIGAHTTTYPCPQCSYECLDGIDLKLHMKMRHSVANRQSSVKRHAGSQTTTYRCPQCPYEGSDGTALKVHIKKKHSVAKATRQSPVKTRAGRQTTTYRCPQCSYEGSDSTDLKLHIKKKHSVVKATRQSPIKTRAGGQTPTYPCPLCSYEGSDSTDMKNHLKKKHSVANRPSPVRSHSGNMSYPCDICSYRGRNRHATERHRKRLHPNHPEMKIPADSRPPTFPCPRCSFNGSDPTDLKGHIKNKHCAPNRQSPVKENPAVGKSYVCRICEFQTPHLNYVLAHMKTSHQKPARTGPSLERAQTRTALNGSEIQPGVIVQDQLVILQMPHEKSVNQMMVRFEMDEKSFRLDQPSEADPLACSEAVVRGELVDFGAQNQMCRSVDVVEEAIEGDVTDGRDLGDAEGIVVCDYFTGARMEQTL